jgi:hypothetical protein
MLRSDGICGWIGAVAATKPAVMHMFASAPPLLEVECLVSTDDEAFTYNKRISTSGNSE